MVKIPEEFSHLEMNDQLEVALDSILNQRENTIVMGNAGTGKSCLIDIVKAVSPLDTILLAPTGTAAVNIGGQTIHSFFGFPPALIEGTSLVPKENVYEILQHTRRIIIDEVPMVRVDLMEGIDYILKQYMGNTLPFGGIQMVLIGDPYQLPPILKEDSNEGKYVRDIWPGKYFFHSYGFKSSSWNVIELLKVYRQKDPVFTSSLNKIRKGLHSTNDLNLMNSRVMSKIEYEDMMGEESETYVYLTSLNKIAERINEDRLMELPGQASYYSASYTPTVDLKNFTPPVLLSVKEGALVMLLVNNGPYNNGDMGIVKETGPDFLIIDVFRKGRIKVGVHTFEQIEYDYDSSSKRIMKKVIGTFEQIPVKLAWAMTVHKSQGQTFESGYIDIPHTFAEHMIYVALSRFRHLEKIGLKKPLQVHDIKIHPDVREFMSQFEKGKLIGEEV